MLHRKESSRGFEQREIASVRQRIARWTFWRREGSECDLRSTCVSGRKHRRSGARRSLNPGRMVCLGGNRRARLERDSHERRNHAVEQFVRRAFRRTWRLFSVRGVLSPACGNYLRDCMDDHGAWRNNNEQSIAAEIESLGGKVRWSHGSITEVFVRDAVLSEGIASLLCRLPNLRRLTVWLPKAPLTTWPSPK